MPSGRKLLLIKNTGMRKSNITLQQIRVFWKRVRSKLFSRIIRKRRRSSRLPHHKYYTIPTLHQRNTFKIKLPADFKVIVTENVKLHNLVFYIYSETYACTLVFNKSAIYSWNYSAASNNFILIFNKNHLLFGSSYRIVSNFIKSLYCYLVCRIKMRGRLYRIYPHLADSSGEWRLPDENTWFIAHRSGRTHISETPVLDAMSHFYRKRRLMLYGTSRLVLRSDAREIQYWFPMDTYTGRGVIIKRTRWYRRTGKVSNW